MEVRGRVRREINIQGDVALRLAIYRPHPKLTVFVITPAVQRAIGRDTAGVGHARRDCRESLTRAGDIGWRESGSGGTIADLSMGVVPPAHAAVVIQNRAGVLLPHIDRYRGPARW